MSVVPRTMNPGSDRSKRRTHVVLFQPHHDAHLNHFSQEFLVTAMTRRCTSRCGLMEWLARCCAEGRVLRWMLPVSLCLRVKEESPREVGGELLATRQHRGRYAMT